MVSSAEGRADGLVEELARWEVAGGHWRVAASDETRVDIDLLTCDGGEEMSRISLARTAELDGFLRGRTSSTD